MIWVVHCLDLPGAAVRRAANRATHSSRLKAQTDVGVITGGPLLADGPDSAAIGSLFLVEAADRQQVMRFLAEDPFSTNQVWGEVRVNGFLSSAALIAPTGTTASRDRATTEVPQ